MTKGALQVSKNAFCKTCPGRVRYLDIGRGAFAISVAGGWLGCLGPGRSSGINPVT